MKRTILFALLSSTFPILVFAQPQHFTFTANTGDSYSIVVDNATLDGSALASGDEIGVFTPAGLCVGASVWTGTTPLALVAWADDSQTPTVDGYVTGEKMSFRIWDASASSEYDATPTYSAGNGNFGDGAFARLTLAATSGAAQSITVVSPNGGEVWQVGTQQEIKWTSTNFTDPVLIRFSPDYTASWDTVAVSTANDGSYMWTIPNTPSNQCVMQIMDAADGDPWDASDGVFTVTAAATPSITVVSPNGGEDWQVGTQQEIKWTSTNFTDPVKIEYSTDGGTSYNDIETSTGNDGTHIWQVPNNPSSQCRVRISDAADGDPSDTSDAVFTISSGPPAGGGLIVQNTDDSGPGSLRDAIMQANTHVGMDTIFFNIPKGVPGHDPDVGIWTISPASPLPQITDEGLIIDGRSQAQFVGASLNPDHPEIELDGSNAGNANGLHVTASGVEIYRLTINRFSQQAGIVMDHVDAGRISGCYIGTDFGGHDAAGNYHGVKLLNSQGVQIVPLDTLPNVLSGNAVEGIALNDTSRHNLVLGNILGLNRTAEYAIGNSYGVSMFNMADSNEVLENRIGGNTVNGVAIVESNGNVVVGNRIGTDEAWELELGNLNNGIYIASYTTKAQNNVIMENIIGHNTGAGVAVSSANALYNRITRNGISRNGGAGINNYNGGNSELAPPIILSVSESAVSGTAAAGHTVELFADEENEGMAYLGSTTADASGNFSFSFPEPPPLPNITATATDAPGNTSQFSAPANISAVEDASETQIPKEFKLSQNYPNPFNPQTVIRYELPTRTHVKLVVVNLLGAKVKTLLDEAKNPGSYSASWNGTDHLGGKVASGVYLYRLEAGEFVSVKKMVLIR
ncbi:MAG: T9SS type A sorting domain-containing protein [bacterium]